MFSSFPTSAAADPSAPYLNGYPLYICDELEIGCRSTVETRVNGVIRKGATLIHLLTRSMSPVQICINIEFR